MPLPMRRPFLQFGEESDRGRNVRVFHAHAAALLRELGRRTQELVKANEEVEEVRLFGSLGRGEASPGSEAAIVVIVRRASKPFLDRSADLARFFASTGIGCEVLVYRREELAKIEHQSPRFARVLATESQLLAGGKVKAEA